MVLLILSGVGSGILLVSPEFALVSRGVDCQPMQNGLGRDDWGNLPHASHRPPGTSSLAWVCLLAL